jgi:hypothetical protein
MVSIDKLETTDCYGTKNILISRDFHVTLTSYKTGMSGQVVVTTKDKLN